MPSATSFTAFCRLIGLSLEPFQVRIVRAAFGLQSETLILLPRGNGKSVLSAAIALHHLVTVPDAAAYCAASSREQARIVFEAARTFALELDDPHVVPRHLEIRWCEDPDQPKIPDRTLRVLAAEAMRLHGLSPTLAIIDELHAHKDADVYLAMRTAVLKRPGSKLITISTAGQGADSPLGQLRARAHGLPYVTRRGAVTDARGPSLRMLEWAVGDQIVPTAKAAKVANPASWITVGALAEQRDAVPDGAWRRYHCNQWTAAEGSWLPAGAWQACVGEPALADGEDVWVGVDLGGETSSTAVCWINAHHHVGCWIGHGDSAILQARDLVEDLAGRYHLREVAFDPWRAGQLAQELQERGVRVSAFPQTDARMIPASQRLYQAVVERELVLPPDQELARHASDAVAKHSRRGWRLDSPHARKLINIDGVVALAMALDRASAPQSAGLEFIGAI
jgi:phage terminase large subunit-like protein